jgi:hypothetical protein
VTVNSLLLHWEDGLYVAAHSVYEMKGLSAAAAQSWPGRCWRAVRRTGSEGYDRVGIGPKHGSPAHFAKHPCPTAYQKDPMGLLIRCIRMTRARVSLADLELR